MQNSFYLLKAIEETMSWHDKALWKIFQESYIIFNLLAHKMFFPPQRQNPHKNVLCVWGGGLLYLYADWILIVQYIAFINFFAINGTFKVEDKVDLSQ